MVLDMCQRVLQDDRQTEKEARTAAQLAMVVLHHCKGRVDEYIPPILVMISERVKTVRAMAGRYIIERSTRRTYHDLPDLARPGQWVGT